ncbi:5'-nucleotidase C-terminal domain-containing protein [Streptococcus sp. 121]|uniref:cell surface ecto-5'-nucleotidase Nt5e n=1 Tax=Streptococcus sp. 121 TaxID=2797637 RepID=UPI0018F0C5AC|nr:cell surface ecto-5'-nucleotidase Nt5e [Streptococcus sp. 121]MBJ6745259.1 5'-nucleotidase C-terminal domain-containing protein [Streptococcus sp. 121]
MKKESLLPLVSAGLLAPFFLSTGVAADEVSAEQPAATAETVNQVQNPAAEQPAATAETLASQPPVVEVPEVTPADSSAATANADVAPRAVSLDAEAAQESKDLVILHTNDVHGRIVEDRNVIGDAKAAAVIKETKADLVVDAGDAFQGLPISNSSKGEERLKILNMVGYDAIAVGNHEFDFGLDQLRKYEKMLTFPILSANTYVDGARLFKASTIVDKDKTIEGDEFVVIGVTTPETATKTHPNNVVGVTFTEPITEVQNVIAQIESEARAEGKTYKNYVILAHLGVDATTPLEWRGDTLAEALSKNENLKGKRVILIDGHSHTVATATYGENVTYNQTGSYLNNIGKIVLKSDKLLGEASLISAADLKDQQPDPEIAAVVSRIKEAYDADNAVVIRANNTVELNGKRENVRVRETNLGNAVTDALYAYGQTGFQHPSHLAVTNGGGLRETIAKDKDITKGDVIAVLPFGNLISQITVKGQQIQDMFKRSISAIHQKDADGNVVLDENGLPLLEPSGYFLHVSGARVFFDPSLEPADRILKIQILDPESGKYQDLDLEKTYYLATNDFVAAGGDGYDMLGGAREEGPSMDEVFANFLKTADLSKYEVVNPNSRIVSVSKDADANKNGIEDWKELANPTEPAKPEQPENPTNPNQPSKPTNPSRPSKPLNPANPSQPNKPVQQEGQAGQDKQKPATKLVSLGHNPSYQAPAKVQATSSSASEAKSLPNTGTEDNAAAAVLGLGILATLGLVQSKRRKN